MASSGRSSRENTAKSVVNDQISQAIQSTSNLLQLMQQSSSQTQLMKLPKNLLAKTPTIKNTGQLLEQMPRVISSLDAHMESGLQSIPHLETVIRLLENMESSQLSSLAQTPGPLRENVLTNQVFASSQENVLTNQVFASSQENVLTNQSSKQE